jgi:hypothetical protein
VREEDRPGGGRGPARREPAVPTRCLPEKLVSSGILDDDPERMLLDGDTHQLIRESQLVVRFLDIGAGQRGEIAHRRIGAERVGAGPEGVTEPHTRAAQQLDPECASFG